MSFKEKSDSDYHYSTDGRFGTVNYKGVEQQYTRIDDKDWHQFRSQGDDSEDDYFGGSWEMEDQDNRRDEAAEKAKEEYTRRTQLRADVDANTAAIGKNLSGIEDLNKEPDDPAPTPDANLQGKPEVEKPELPEVFNQPAAQGAKSKAQAYKAGSSGFQAGDLSSIKSTMTKPGATESEAPAQPPSYGIAAQGAVYGNVTPGEAADEHANNLLSKYTNKLSYGAS